MSVRVMPEPSHAEPVVHRLHVAARDSLARRMLESVAASILLVIFAPVMLLVALVIKIEAPQAPVFYKQVRVGINRRSGRRERRTRPIPEEEERRARRSAGRPFSIWKFRTMIPDAEAATGPVWATEDDPRITPVGRFLRAARLDELPQLINVIRGDMRLVGPRPERPQFVDTFTDGVPGYAQRLRVPPGITGLAQVERAYDADVEDVRKKLRYDLYYIEHRRALLDLKILFKTLSVVLRRRGSR